MIFLFVKFGIISYINRDSMQQGVDISFCFFLILSQATIYNFVVNKIRKGDYL